MLKFPYTEIVDETKRAWLMKMPAKKYPVRVPKQGTKLDVEHHVVAIPRFAAEFLGLVKLAPGHKAKEV